MLGPRLLILYTLPTSYKPKNMHRVIIHSFADDKHLYLQCTSVATIQHRLSSAVRLAHCIWDINQWTEAEHG